ncbi:MAG: DUF305 domain-containing protein [Actinomycetota bacterium]|nr:DUF305 domain-containing protein [Actinomycetota bacterium]
MKLLAVLLAVGALTVTGCGSSSDDKDASSAVGNPVDRAFVGDMIPHHRSAVQMATIAQQRASSAFVRKLADDIVRTQSEEIDLMRTEDRRLAAAGVGTGSLGVAEHMMGTDGDIASLKSAKPFDEAFIKMMLPHHEGAVVMAKAELAKGRDPKLKTLAQDIITAQQREITAMRRHRGARGAMNDHMGAGHSD